MTLDLPSGIAVDSVQVCRVTTVEPPAGVVVKGTVASVKVVVLVPGAEGHAVVITQRVSCVDGVDGVVVGIRGRGLRTRANIMTTLDLRHWSRYVEVTKQ